MHIRPVSSQSFQTKIQIPFLHNLSSTHISLLISSFSLHVPWFPPHEVTLGSLKPTVLFFSFMPSHRLPLPCLIWQILKTYFHLLKNFCPPQPPPSSWGSLHWAFLSSPASFSAYFHRGSTTLCTTSYFSSLFLCFSHPPDYPPNLACGRCHFEGIGSNPGI